MTKLRTTHELHIFGNNKKDQDDLTRALVVFVRNTSHVLRTSTNQISFKFDHPESNSRCTMYYIGLKRDGVIVGFCMLGYFPRARVVLIDHLVIDAENRKYGAFFVFASLIRSLIEERFPAFDYVVAEVATDREFSDDEVSGKAVIKILRQVGFGEVRVRYALANTEPREFRRTYKGSLLIRAAQKISSLRAEEFLTIYNVILFDHYLGWCKDFFGSLTPKYESHLNQLYISMENQLRDKATVFVNGATEDQTVPQTKPRSTGPLMKSTVHVILFLLVATVLIGLGWLFAITGMLFLSTVVVIILSFAAIMSLTNSRALNLTQQLIDLLKRIFRKE